METCVGGVIKVCSGEAEYTPTYNVNINKTRKNQTEAAPLTDSTSVIFKVNHPVNNVSNNKAAEGVKHSNSGKIPVTFQNENKIEHFQQRKKIGELETFRGKIKSLIFHIREINQYQIQPNGVETIYQNLVGGIFW